MEQKFSDVYRTSFLTLDRYLQQSNSAQFYFRPLLPPLNTVSGEFYSLSPAQGTDPSIRINEYSSNGSLVGFGYVYDTSLNTPPNYWTLTGSNIYNNNQGFVGIGTVAPAATLDVSGNASIRGPALSNLLFVGDASLNNPVAEQDTVKIGTAGVGGRLAIGDDGKGVLRMLNAFGDTYIETGTNMAVGSSGRLIFSSMFDLSGGPTMSVNTGTDEVVISNRFIDPPVAGYKLTVDGSANVLGNVKVSGAVTATGTITSSVTTASRGITYTNPINNSITSFVNYNADISGLPYSVYLVTVEASVDVVDGPDTTAYCDVTISNEDDTPIQKRYYVSCSVTTGTVSVGTSITSITPINRGSINAISVSLILNSCVFANPSSIYIQVTGLC